MKLTIEKQERYTVIKPEEEKLDTLIAPALKSEFTTLNAEGVKNIILDMSAVKYADSSGLSAILVANRLCGNLNGFLVITGVQSHVMKLIEISQLTSVLNVLPTVQEAVEAIFMSDIESEIKNEDSQ